MGLNDNNAANFPVGIPLGVSGTDMNNQQFGMLKTLGGSSEAAQQAMAFANQLYPSIPKADPWEAAFQFFAEMGKQASVPGSTALGAGVSSLQAPLDYLNAKKKELAETKRARMTAAVQLAPNLKPPTSTSKYKRTVFKPDGSKRDVYSQAEFDSATALVTDKNPNGGWSTSQPASTSSESSALTDYKFSSPAGLAKFKEEYPNVILSAEQEAGTVPISLPNSISNDPDLLGAFVKYKAPGAGSQYERIFASVNDIGTRIAAFNADNTLAPVSQNDINEYAANYQKLIAGGEFTEIVNGEEVTRRKPGIDLSETTNLPTPAGLDLEAILKQRRQSFDQNQNTNATFGSRMLYNEGIIRNVYAEGYQLTLEDIARISTMGRLGLGTLGVDPLARQYHAAAQNWVAAQLRNESGAAIAPSEYADALMQYFPVVGDDRSTLDQKRALREASVRGMINSSGGAFEVVYSSGTKYLSYTSDGQTFDDVLNPQGYANELLSKTKLGQNLYFKDSLMSQTTENLEALLANPTIQETHTAQMIDYIIAELAKPERN
mgnify:CR=1 FL=1|tara:strand:- start:1978 stop:3621 length:1644 start_codon:yes stop_codon:yes gene_type:complete